MTRSVLIALAIVACLTGGCRINVGPDAPVNAPPAAAGEGSDPVDQITVASFDFTENRVVAEIYAQALEAWGYPTERALGLASRELLEPALEQGLVDLVPEYAGTALQFLTTDPKAASADPAVTHARLEEAFAARNIAVLDGAPAQNQNALVVERETADKYRLTAVSDLQAIAPQLVLGGPPECPSRPLCLVGFREVYGLHFERFVPLDVGGPLTVAALEGDEIDVAVLFTGDRPVIGRQLVFLADDLGLQPAENITPVVRQEVIDAHGPELRRRLDRVTRRLTTADLADLVRRVDVDREDPARLAAAWLRRTAVLPSPAQRTESG
jgi:osmoprotectant transport system substrate-binding protein